MKSLLSNNNKIKRFIGYEKKIEKEAACPPKRYPCGQNK
jgi:hypothetical protein